MRLDRIAAGLGLTLLFAACSEDRSPTTPALNVEQAGLPGTRPETEPAFSASASVSAAETESGLQMAATATGQVLLSVDGIGTLAASGAIRVEKPSAGATVRSAYLASASTGFTSYSIPDGAVTLAGTAVAWDASVQSAISSWNHWADVTAHVKDLIDGAAPGIVQVPFTQAYASLIEGHALAVIFDDPEVEGTNTVALLFGAQRTSGDYFYVATDEPLDADDADLVLDMGLGISFGFQPTSQYVLVDVNGQRLTSCAGGQDDGANLNGALVTVGGVGDSNANPAPNCDPYQGPYIDDEMYSLKPFISTGDQLIEVFTRNPSNDDNVFFAWLFMNTAGSVDIDPPTEEPPPPPTEDTQACSAGFWPNAGIHRDVWPSGYAPSAPVGSVFAAADGYLGSVTLAQALAGYAEYRTTRSSLAGAGEILLRQAVAAALNEAAFGAGFPAAGVASLQADVAAALTSDDRGTILELAARFDAWNNSILLDEDGSPVLDDEGHPVVTGSCPL